VSRTIETVEDTENLQKDLNTIISWSRQNNMDLHKDKFELINCKINSSKVLSELHFTSCLHSYETPNGNYLLPSNSVKDLGVILTPDCLWTTLINTIAESAKKWHHGS
jgi:hypothetical protein